MGKKNALTNVFRLLGVDPNLDECLVEGLVDSYFVAAISWIIATIALNLCPSECDRDNS